MKENKKRTRPSVAAPERAEREFCLAADIPTTKNTTQSGKGKWLIGRENA